MSSSQTRIPPKREASLAYVNTWGSRCFGQENSASQASNYSAVAVVTHLWGYLSFLSSDLQIWWVFVLGSLVFELCPSFLTLPTTASFTQMATPCASAHNLRVDLKISALTQGVSVWNLVLLTTSSARLKTFHQQAIVIYQHLVASFLQDSTSFMRLYDRGKSKAQSRLCEFFLVSL